jgi:PHS family inorganic phosphate transporter-like MFS transporter
MSPHHALPGDLPNHPDTAGSTLVLVPDDFIYYGTTFNQVTLSDDVFGGPAQTLFEDAWRNAILTSCGLPAVTLGLLLLCSQPSRWMQLWGFSMQLAACLALAIVCHVGGSAWARFACFCGVLFSLQFGVNLSTYNLPAEIFPTEVRSTFFGLAAAGGKLGAFVGSYAFGPLQKSIHIDGVYFLCAGVSLCGILVTLLLIPPPVRMAPEDVADLSHATTALSFNTPRERSEALLGAGSVQSDSGHGNASWLRGNISYSTK